MSTAAAALDPALRPLLTDPDQPYSEWFALEHSPQMARQLALWGAAPTRAFMEKMADGLEPGGALFIVLRKRYVEEQVRLALARGAAQVVMLGAGYDPLGIRLAGEPDGPRVFELDLPATQAVKRRALEKRAALPPRLTIVSEDLSRGTLAERLAVTPGFRREEKSVFVAEGLLMYFEPAQVDAVLAAVRRVAAPGSRFVFTLMDARLLAERGSPAAGTARLLALSGEPIRSSLDGARIEEFLGPRGLRLLAQADGAALRKAYLDPLGLARPVGEGEWILVTESTG